MGSARCTADECFQRRRSHLESGRRGFRRPRSLIRRNEIFPRLLVWGVLGVVTVLFVESEFAPESSFCSSNVWSSSRLPGASITALVFGLLPPTGNSHERSKASLKSPLDSLRTHQCGAGDSGIMLTRRGCSPLHPRDLVYSGDADPGSSGQLSWWLLVRGRSTTSKIERISLTTDYEIGIQPTGEGQGFLGHSGGGSAVRAFRHAYVGCTRR